MQTGATSQVVLEWANLHTTASIRVFMLVLGGDDITDAYVGVPTINGLVNNTDIALPSGFGRPELVFALSAGGLTTAAESVRYTFGFAKQGEVGRCWAFGQLDGNTASLTAASCRDNRLYQSFDAGNIAASSASVENEGQLDTTLSNWPTDGFRIVHPTQTVNAIDFGYLALRTDAQIATGSDTAPITGTPTVNQDDDVGFAPKLAMVLSSGMAANAGTMTSDAEQVVLGVGAYDGTEHAHAGFMEDDALGTMNSNTSNSIAAIIRNYNVSAASQSEASGVFTGNIFRRAWSDIDTIARNHQWLVMGDGSSVVTTPIAISAGLTLTPALVRVPIRPKAIAAGLTATAALVRVKIAPKAILAELTLTAALIRGRFHTLPVTLTGAPALSRKLFRPIDAGLALTAALTKARLSTQAISTGLTLDPVLVRVKNAPRALAVSVTLTPVMVRGLYRTLAVGLASNPALVKAKKALVSIPGTLVMTSTLALEKTQGRLLQVDLTMAPVISRVITRIISIPASLTVAPTLNRKLFKTIPAGLTMAPTLVRAMLRLRTIAAGLTLTGQITLKKTILRALSAALSAAPSLTLRMTRLIQINASLSLTAAQAKVLKKTLGTNLTLVALVDGDKLRLIAVPASLVMTPSLTAQKLVGQTTQINLNANMPLTITLSGRRWRPGPGVIAVDGSPAQLVAVDIEDAKLVGTDITDAQIGGVS
jgi:hypothetical protein